MNDKEDWALVTGASKGIGKEFSITMAKRGYNLILVARDATSLSKLQTKIESENGVKVKVMVKDLANPVNSPDEIFDEIVNSNLNLKRVINNAGFGKYGDLALSDTSTNLDQINVNISSLVAITKLAINRMQTQADEGGKILNVASTAAFQPGPNASIYFATKAFVLHFTEAVTEELKGSKISLSCLCPGATDTGFFKNANWHNSLLASLGMMSPTDVALCGINGMEKGTGVIIAGLKNRLLVFSTKFAPRKVVTKIAERLGRPV